MRRVTISGMALALGVLVAACADRGCGAPVATTSSSAGTAESDAAIDAKLAQALRDKGPGYVPRTRHKNADGSPRYTNRLILAASPYLLQHAHNPVNWFPWGDEAFARAKALGRPVFLSIGYATCHWCHVMEEESFEDEEIARYLNEHYVAIKVDREERPDLDAVYMSFVSALTGGGGWPMSVWLTAARDPFYGGTYFPPRAGVRGARRGFLDVLRAEAERFAKDPASVVAEAQSEAKRLEASTASAPLADVPGPSILDAALVEAKKRFDADHGGTRGAPKFPSSFPVRLLLRIARRTNDSDARAMARKTLDSMRDGGIRDQLGGGFHRYATDARWLVPHFEKMLYDNADLALAYLEAGTLTGDGADFATAREVLDDLVRSMRTNEGLFASASDADSPTSAGVREEGAFFTWTRPEIEAVVGVDAAAIAASYYGVNARGPVDGRSVLSVVRSIADVARDRSMPEPAVAATVADARARLFDARSKRPPPLRDDKAIVAWNGLAISALARAAIVLGEPRYAEAAERAARGILAPVVAGAPLPHVFLGDRQSGLAFADDLAFFAAALVDLFELSADGAYLAQAIALMDELERSFSDADHGGYFLTSLAHERLLFRDKPDQDGPMPAPSSVAALTWLKLYAFTSDERFRVRAEATLRAFAKLVESRPLRMDRLLYALDWATDSAKEIVLVVPEGRGALAPLARPMLDALSKRFLPNAAIVVTDEAHIAADLGSRLPWLIGKTAHAGKATAYVCERGACKLPTTDPAEFAKLVAAARPYRE